MILSSILGLLKRRPEKPPEVEQAQTPVLSLPERYRANYAPAIVTLAQSAKRQSIEDVDLARKMGIPLSILWTMERGEMIHVSYVVWLDYFYAVEELSAGC